MILGAALEEFASQGYEAASMGRIATAAGVTRSVLYDHFCSKSELFSTLLETTTERLISQMTVALGSAAPAEERWRAAFDAFFEFAEEEPLSWQVMFPERPPADPVVAAEYQRLRAKSNKLLADVIEPDARRTGIDPRSPVGQAMFACHLAAIHGAVQWWHKHPAATRTEVVEAAVNVLWFGLGGLGAPRLPSTGTERARSATNV
jgi:AcrR family transcriptional regulator